MPTLQIYVETEPNEQVYVEIVPGLQVYVETEPNIQVYIEIVPGLQDYIETVLNFFTGTIFQRFKIMCPFLYTKGQKKKDTHFRK